MAEALEKDMIPCENCSEQVNLDDWSIHVRHCFHGEKKQVENSTRAITNEPIIDGIPCEFCDTQVNLDDWESHSKQCADTHNSRIKKLKNMMDESIVELIPCEYCDAQINVNDWESHSKQCVNSSKLCTSNVKTDGNKLMDALIPCEYCGSQVSLDNWTWHTNQCADADRRRVENIIKQNEAHPDANLIPCDICKESFVFQDFAAHQTECQLKQASSVFTPNALHEQTANGLFSLPRHWDQSSPHNLSRYTLQPDSEEYKFVADNFHKTLTSNEIVQIERIQNRRWYRQYDAHKDDFIERYGTSTEQWLFHGCKSTAIDAIIKDCFNRSHAVRFAAGQGIYFATQASTSLGYTQPTANNLRHMFMARVLVGRTTAGNQSTRVCPPGFDTTGGGTVFVTYHDAQAYGEYLICFR